MCRDSTAGSAPQMRAGLRRAIPVLAVPAMLLFAGFLIVAKRSRAWEGLNDGERDSRPDSTVTLPEEKPGADEPTFAQPNIQT